MKIDRLTLFTGISGFALLGLGLAMAYKQRQALSGLGRGRLREAPVIGTYTDGNMRTTLRSSPNMPIEERIATIQDLIHKSVQDPLMRKTALQVTAQCAERDKVCEAQAIYHFVKQRVRYTGDVGDILHPDGSVEGIDLYQSARRTLEMGGGDCDDNAILVATLLALNGITPKLRVVKERGAPDWQHIFAVAQLGPKMVALDTTLPGNTSFGVEPRYSKKIDFDA